MLANNEENCSLTIKQQQLNTISNNEKLILQSIVQIQILLNSSDNDKQTKINNEVLKITGLTNGIKDAVKKIKNDCQTNEEDINKLKKRAEDLRNKRNELENNLSEINRTNETVIVEKEKENKKWLYFNVSLSVLGTIILLYTFSQTNTK